MKMRKFQTCVGIKSLYGSKSTDGWGSGRVIEVDFRMLDDSLMARGCSKHDYQK